MKRLTLRYFVSLLLTIMSNLWPNTINLAHAQTKWQPLLTGLEYAKITPVSVYPWAFVHAFRINPTQFNFDLALAKDYQLSSASVRQLAEKANAILAVNGGFFNSESQPIGLRITNNEVRNPLKKISWLGVFYFQGNTPYIVSQKQFQHHKQTHFAIQGGPRLIVNGQIPPLKPGTDERTAIGITHHNQVIILITENSPMTTTQLAEFMRSTEEDDGLNCRDALNLDGGHSTQLYAQIGDFNLDVPGVSSIADAIYISKRPDM